MRCESVNIDPQDTSRSCGFLTQTEREYLLGEWNPNDGEDGFSDEQGSRKRSDIEIRTRHGLADLALLQEHGDQELKENVIKRNVEPAIFAPKAMGHMAEGMGKFALDASVGEDFTEVFFPVLQQEGVSEQVLDLLESALSGDPEEVIIQLFEMMTQLASEAEMSEDEFIELAQESDVELPN